MEERIYVGRQLDKEPYVRVCYSRIGINRMKPGNYIIWFDRRTIHVKNAAGLGDWDLTIDGTGRIATNAKHVMSSVAKYFYQDRELPNEWANPDECFPAYISYGRYRKSSDEWIFSKWEEE